MNQISAMRPSLNLRKVPGHCLDMPQMTLPRNALKTCLGLPFDAFLTIMESDIGHVRLVFFLVALTSPWEGVCEKFGKHTLCTQ